MNPKNNSPHSFNFQLSGERTPNLRCSHRRHNSEPLVSTTLPGARRKLSNFSALMEQQRTHTGYGDIALGSSPDRLGPALAAPAPVTLRLKPQYSIRRPRPNTEIFGLACAPEIVLGEPKEHVGHPKTRIGQPALKLAAIKERMEQLEATNERLQQRIESYRTDAEMLSSSVTYFSSEYYAGLLTIRDLRSRSRQDAEIMSSQEQQLCQLKKFVGLMVEIGLHEPVLERAHQSVLAGEDFEPILVEAIRTAAARRGSAWSGILLSAVSLPQGSTRTVPKTDAPDVFDDRESTVDNLLKSLKNGDIPSGRHRSWTLRFNPPANKSPLRHQSTPPRNSLRLIPKDAGVPLSPHSPVRSVLGKLDVNRSPQNQKSARGSSKGRLSVRSAKPATSMKPSTDRNPAPPAEARRTDKPPCTNTSATAPDGGDTAFSTERALASLQRILDNFSSGSLGSLGTTTEGTQSADCGSPAIQTPVRPTPTLRSPATARSTAARSPSARTPPRLFIRPPTACSAATKAVSPARKAKHLTVLPSPVKRSVELGSSPGRYRHTFDSGTTTNENQSRKGGWR
ncbi:hypothetical protein FB451DRAFT_1212582 [Mycena latifolia]|nr:hypothetical protein FB451DRAFT_1212582 [Mycena latifolia]